MAWLFTILRITRHPAEPVQLEPLKKILGGPEGHEVKLQIIEHNKTVRGVEEVRELVYRYRPDVLEVVLPLHILADVLKVGSGINCPVIRAIMNRALSPDGKGATFTFQRYERIREVEVVVEPFVDATPRVGVQEHLARSKRIVHQAILAEEGADHSSRADRREPIVDVHSSVHDGHYIVSVPPDPDEQ